MKITRRFNLIILCVFTLFTSSTAVAFQDQSLYEIDNNKHKLTEYIGQGDWVVLNIWGTQCPPCREEIPELVNFHDEHKNDGSIVVSIAIDFPSYGYAKKDDVIAFSEDYLIDFPILLSDATITEKIGLGRLKGLPTTYIFNPIGEVVGTQVGTVTKNILENFINNLKNKSN